MLPGLALVLLAAWTARALEVGAALRNGGRGDGVGTGLPKSLIQRSRGQWRGPRSPPRPTPPLAVALRILASGPALSGDARSSPRRGSREASGSRVRAARGASRGGDPELRPSLSPCLPAAGWDRGRREPCRWSTWGETENAAPLDPVPTS